MQKENIVEHALHYMEEHYNSRLTLEEVAQHVYISPWYLSKVFNQYMERSFPTIRNQIRIKYAKQMLKESDFPIFVIAEMVGFQASCHFSRTFKKIVGISPDEYRNSQFF